MRIRDLEFRTAPKNPVVALACLRFDQNGRVAFVTRNTGPSGEPRYTVLGGGLNYHEARAEWSPLRRWEDMAEEEADAHLARLEALPPLADTRGAEPDWPAW
jgi:hypothetical protein